MSISVSQAFKRTSANPVDETLTLTKAQMLAINDNLMPSKYLTVCQDDGFIYLYDKSATPNQTTGKFTKFEGGGGGVTDYDDLTDKPQIGGVTLSGNKSLSDLGITKSGLGLGSVVNTGDSATPTSGGTTKFTTGGAYTELAKKQDKLTASTNITIDSSNNISASMPVLGTINRSDILSTTEKIVGCNTDGRPIYQKTVSIGALPNNTTKYVAHNISNMRAVTEIVGIGYNSSTGQYCNIPIPFYCSSTLTYYDVFIAVTTTNIEIYTARDWSSLVTCYVTIRYTKTTDSANSYNYADENDYSFSEKIIGTWVDGSRLFQRCVSFTMPTVSQDGIVAQTLVDLSSWGATLYTEVSGMFWKDPDNTVQSVPLGVAFNTSTSLQYGTRAFVNSTRQLTIESNYASFSGRPGIAILKYVKS